MDFTFLTTLAYHHYIIASIIIGFLSSFTILFPSPFFVLIFFLSTHFSPFWVGIFAGLGAALGELTSYYTGFLTERIFFKKFEDKFNRIEKKFKKYHPSFVIFITAATPAPFDLIGILCGLLKHDVKDFLFFTALGKIIKYWFIAYAGYYGLHWLHMLFNF